MMDVLLRAARAADEPFLWEMLYHAAQMADHGARSAQAARANAYLAPFVACWGRTGDLGVLALDGDTQQPVGAAWVRLLDGPAYRYHGVAASTPELAIAVSPTYSGRGIGTQLLRRLLSEASAAHQAVVLSVRAENPAQHLYARNGFVVVGEKTNRVGGRSLIMLRTFAYL